MEKRTRQKMFNIYAQLLDILFKRDVYLEVKIVLFDDSIMRVEIYNN